MADDEHGLVRAESEVVAPSAMLANLPAPRSSSEIIAPSAMFMDLMMLEPLPTSEKQQQIPKRGEAEKASGMPTGFVPTPAPQPEMQPESARAKLPAPVPAPAPAPAPMQPMQPAPMQPAQPAQPAQAPLMGRSAAMGQGLAAHPAAAAAAAMLPGSAAIHPLGGGAPPPAPSAGAAAMAMAAQAAGAKLLHQAHSPPPTTAPAHRVGWPCAGAPPSHFGGIASHPSCLAGTTAALPAAAPTTVQQPGMVQPLQTTYAAAGQLQAMQQQAGMPTSSVQVRHSLQAPAGGPTAAAPSSLLARGPSPATAGGAAAVQQWPSYHAAASPSATQAYCVGATRPGATTTTAGVAQPQVRSYTAASPIPGTAQRQQPQAGTMLASTIKLNGPVGAGLTAPAVAAASPAPAMAAAPQAAPSPSPAPTSPLRGAQVTTRPQVTTASAAGPPGAVRNFGMPTSTYGPPMTATSVMPQVSSRSVPVPLRATTLPPNLAGIPGASLAAPPPQVRTSTGGWPMAASPHPAWGAATHGATVLQARPMVTTAMSPQQAFMR